jgi:hypothetical protein
MKDTTTISDPRLAIGQRWEDKRDLPRTVAIVAHGEKTDGWGVTRPAVQVRVVVPSKWAGPKTVGRKTWIIIDRIGDFYRHDAGAVES